jgi:methylenetetrahydrofolate reductase (NADPH)
MSGATRMPPPPGPLPSLPWGPSASRDPHGLARERGGNGAGSALPREGEEDCQDGPYSLLHATLRRGRFAVTAEIGPPRSATVEPIRRKARLLRDWIDAANVTDSQSAVARLGSLAGSLAVIQEGVEPVMQLQCRDKNRIALQSELLSGAALGVPNVLLLTGDHPRFGDHPDAKPVFDLDSIQLIWTARMLRDQRTLLSGRTLSVPPRYLIGAVENPFAPPLRFRAERLGKKVAAGARFFQTQFVFDVEIFARWMEDVRALGLHERCWILAGVGPIKSLRALEHMRSEVPGMHVPEAVARRLRGVPADRVAQEGLAICAEIVQQVRAIPGVAGIHVMAFSWEDAIPEILERAGLGKRTAAEPPHAIATRQAPRPDREGRQDARRATIV